MILRATCILALSLSFTATAQTFTNITADQGIAVLNNFPVSGVAISFYDFDKDGWDDLSFGTLNQQLKFYRNNEGDFEPVTFPGIDGFGDCKMVCWVDYDNDGDADLFVSYNGLPVRLYRNNGDMTFVNVAAGSGIEQINVVNWGSCWADYNRDGFLDLYICKKYDNGNFLTEYNKLNRLYLNDGDGTFTDMTTYAAVGDSLGISFQSIFWDYDNDMWPDIYVVNDKWFRNGSYRNNGNGTFTDTGPANGLDLLMDAMCAAAGDYDNDGDEDMYITNTPGLNEYEGNVLLNNDNGNFTNVAAAAGVQVVNICWGTTWFDYDNDGWLDFYVATNQGLFNPPNNKVYRNNGNGTFNDVSGPVGMLNDVAPSYSNCTGDINNDGYPDLAANNSIPYNSAVFLSSGGNNNYFKFSVEGVISNKDGIGTKAFCYANEMMQSRVFYCGENYMSQNSQREIFGLGNADFVDSLILFWPSGHIDRHYDLSSNQNLHFIEGSSLQISTNISGSIGICEGDSLIVYASEADNYLWNNDSSSDSLLITEPGFYVVATTNGLGLTANSDTLEVYYYPNPEIQTQSNPPSCHDTFDASIELSNLSPVAIVNVIWNGISGESELSNIAAGLYSYEATDANGCSASGEANVIAPPQLTVESGVTDNLCYGDLNGSAFVSNTAGTGIDSVIWDNNMQGEFIEDLAAGTYQFILVDLNGCAISSEVIVNEPDELIATAITTDAIIDVMGGTATADVMGGTPPYIFDWSVGSNEEMISDLVQGAYGLAIVDANGCELDLICFIDEVTSIIDQKQNLPQVWPNPFSNQINLSAVEIGSDLTIINALGEIVFAKKADEINLIIDASNLPSGMYVLRLSSEDDRKWLLVK